MAWNEHNKKYFYSFIDVRRKYDFGMKINVEDITLNYTKLGNGTPLILLHGNGEDHHIFDELVFLLKNDYTVYAIDSRNHGESSKTSDFSYEVMSKDIQLFIEKLNLENVQIVGFSDGAIIALTLAIDNPEIFNKMVLLGINLKPSDFKEEYMQWLVEEYKKTNDPLLKLMLEQPNVEIDTLRSVTTSTLVVAGENDLFKPHLYNCIVKKMPNAELLIMEGHNHDSYVVGVDILYPHLKRFLR